MCPLLNSDVDECQETTDICGANSTCSNTDGGFICGCEAGFEMEAGSCLGESDFIHSIGAPFSELHNLNSLC